ncbi:MAG: hypothetical protein MN733_10680 [Nitrososphaera sp.]|nr:hypothetical protein [Nitrososphaera sp.]
MPDDKLKFYGFIFFSGYEFLPGDLILTPKALRRWAFEQGLITDPEFQLLLTKRLQELKKCLLPDDKPQIAIAIHQNDGGLSYFEYPYLPLTSLIQRGYEVQIVYWAVEPVSRDKAGSVIDFGEVRFGFWLSDCTEEICSASKAKRIAEKFHQLRTKLRGKYPVKVLHDGSEEITANGDVQAKFFKDGRFFDVQFSTNSQLKSRTLPHQQPIRKRAKSDNLAKK